MKTKLMTELKTNLNEATPERNLETDSEVNLETSVTSMVESSTKLNYILLSTNFLRVSHVGDLPVVEGSMQQREVIISRDPSG